MFLTIFLTVWSGLHVYVFWRAASVPIIERHISTPALIAVAVILWSSFFLPRFFENPETTIITRPLDIIGSNWLGILFLMFSCLLVIDVVTLFGFFLPKLALTLRGAALLAGLALSVIAIVQGLRSPLLTEYEVRLTGLPPDADGLVMVAISDLHLGNLLGEKWLADRMAQVNALRPDLIVMLGDLVEGDSPTERRRHIESLMRRFSAPLGVWAVTGNHERHGGIESSVSFLKGAGISVLRDEWSEVMPGLILAGIDDRGYQPESQSRVDRIDHALAGRPEDAITIFLSHRPERVEEIARANVGLMLCGHTHGGQIWPFTYIASLANRFLEGRYEVEGMPVIVCRGTGTWGPRMRLWSRGEIMRITLRTP